MSNSTQTMSQHKLKLFESGHVCNLHRVHTGRDQTECIHPCALMIQHPRCPRLQMRACIFSSCSFSMRAKSERLSLFLEFQRGNKSLGDFLCSRWAMWYFIHSVLPCVLINMCSWWLCLSFWHHGTRNRALTVYCNNTTVVSGQIVPVQNGRLLGLCLQLAREPLIQTTYHSTLTLSWL